MTDNALDQEGRPFMEDSVVVSSLGSSSCINSPRTHGKVDARRGEEQAQEQVQEPVEVFSSAHTQVYTSKWRKKIFGHGDWTLVNTGALPDWLRDNDFITDHYRPPTPDWGKILFSLTYVHNQTGNIYTHGLPCLAFTGLFFYTFIGILAQWDAVWGDYLSWSIFMICAHFCLGGSSFFHLTLCHSHKVMQLGSRCDYTGISLMIFGSFFIAMYYGFRCQPLILGLYWGASALLAVPCVALSFGSRFYTPSYRTVRMVLYIAFGLCGAAPIAHYCVINGIPTADQVLGFRYIILEGGLYILGALIYGARIPERWWPGAFDNWGHSHQYHHLTSAAAAFCHWYAMKIAFEASVTQPC